MESDSSHTSDDDETCHELSDLDFNDLFGSQENNVLEEVKRLVGSGTSVNVRDKNNSTLLHKAIKRNNLSVFEYLMSRDDIDIEVEGFKSRRALIIAVRYARFDMVKSLVNKSADLEYYDRRDNTAFYYAIKHNNVEIFEYLMSLNKIDINEFHSEGYSLLLDAVYHKNVYMFKRLIELGADPNCYHFNCFTHWAILQFAVLFRPSMCQLLIENGAYINSIDGEEKKSSLHWAVMNDDLETVCLLLYFNADANVLCGELRETPFQMALTDKIERMQQVLLDYVIDFDAKTKTFLKCMSIVDLAIENNSPFVRQIIERGASLDSSQSKSIFSSVLRQKPINYEIVVFTWSKLKGTVNMMNLFYCPEKDNLERFLDVIIESDNFKVAVDSFAESNNLDKFIEKFSTNNLKLKQLTKLVCQLLSEGYELTANDINKVYSCYGYCELFKIFLYTSSDNYSWKPEMVVPRLFFDFRSDVNKIMNKKILIDKEMTEHAFQYAVNPLLLNAFLDKYGQVTSSKVLNLPTVPLLLELARNAARKYIADVLECQNSCQFYTCINFLNIPDDYKEILTFEKKLYEL